MWISGDRQWGESELFFFQQTAPSPERMLQTEGPRSLTSRQLDYINDIVTTVRLATSSGYSRETEIQGGKGTSANKNATPALKGTKLANFNPAPLGTFGFVEWLEGTVVNARKF